MVSKTRWLGRVRREGGCALGVGGDGVSFDFEVLYSDVYTYRTDRITIHDPYLSR